MKRNECRENWMERMNKTERKEERKKVSKQSCKHGAHTYYTRTKRETNRLFLTSFAFSIIFLIYCYTRFVFSSHLSPRVLSFFFNGVFLGRAHNRIKCNIAAAAACVCEVSLSSSAMLQINLVSVHSRFNGIAADARQHISATSIYHTRHPRTHTHSREKMLKPKQKVWEENEWTSTNSGGGGSRSNNTRKYISNISNYFITMAVILFWWEWENNERQRVSGLACAHIFLDMIKRMAVSQAGNKREKKLIHAPALAQIDT